MLAGLARWLLGSVTFSVFPQGGRRGAGERFFSLAARSGASLWGVRRRGEAFSASVRAGQYAGLRAPARRAGVRLRVSRRSGLPFWLRACRRRKGLVAGGALAAALLLWMPSCIWSVNVAGVSGPQAQELLAQAELLGLFPGVPRGDIDPDLLQQSLMRRYPDAGWISVNTRGSVATITLSERVETPPVKESGRYYNVKAARAGQVVSIHATEGEAAVSPGDAVAEGQLLISGVWEDVYGASHLSHAAGEVLARTQRTAEAEVPLRQTIREPTGEAVERRSLRVFSLQFPLTAVPAPQEGYSCTARVETLSFGGVSLPVSLYIERWEGFQEREVVLTEEEAAAQAWREIQAQTDAWEGVELLRAEERAAVQGGVYRLQVQYTGLENIAVESEIFTGGGDEMTGDSNVG